VDRVKVGKCKLCLLNKSLCKSHMIPRAAYDYCRPPAGNPLVANSELIIESSRQLQHPLLCEECEEVLNAGGEDWVVPLFARYDGTFGLFELLKRMTPDATDNGYDGYAAVKNPDIKADKLIHFALGIFWKAAVHSWSGATREPLIELGNYSEPIRKFLRGEAGFPNRMAFNIGVMRPPVKDIAFLAPFRTDEHAYHRFYFYTSGICWTLSVGKSVDAELRASCFANNPGRPVIVGNFSPDIRHAFRTILRFAKKATNVGKYLKGERKA
jgi:hypothetical protein